MPGGEILVKHPQRRLIEFYDGLRIIRANGERPDCRENMITTELR